MNMTFLGAQSPSNFLTGRLSHSPMPSLAIRPSQADQSEGQKEPEVPRSVPKEVHCTPLFGHMCDPCGIWRWVRSLMILAYFCISYLWHAVAIPTAVDVTRTCMQMYCIRDVHTYKHLVQSRSPLENISRQHRMVQRLHKTIYVASTCTFALPAMILRRYLQQYLFVQTMCIYIMHIGYIYIVLHI